MICLSLFLIFKMFDVNSPSVKEGFRIKVEVCQARNTYYYSWSFDLSCYTVRIKQRIPHLHSFISLCGLVLTTSVMTAWPWMDACLLFLIYRKGCYFLFDKITLPRGSFLNWVPFSCIGLQFLSYPVSPYGKISWAFQRHHN